MDLQKSLQGQPCRHWHPWLCRCASTPPPPICDPCTKRRPVNGGSPSTMAISTSLTPRPFSSFITRSQNFAPSLCSIHSPRTFLRSLIATSHASVILSRIDPAMSRTRSAAEQLLERIRCRRRPSRQGLTFRSSIPCSSLSPANLSPTRC